MACGRGSVFRNVTRPPLPILTSTGLTPDDEIVIIVLELGAAGPEPPHAPKRTAHAPIPHPQSFRTPDMVALERDYRASPTGVRDGGVRRVLSVTYS